MSCPWLPFCALHLQRRLAVRVTSLASPKQSQSVSHTNTARILSCQPTRVPVWADAKRRDGVREDDDDMLSAPLRSLILFPFTVFARSIL